jgi:hypothetical protein
LAELGGVSVPGFSPKTVSLAGTSLCSIIVVGRFYEGYIVFFTEMQEKYI